jgi:hypothetical protein
MSLQRVTLWGAALAVFLAVSPYPAAELDQRVWMEVVFTYAGSIAAVVALARSVPLSLFGIWAVGLSLLHRSPYSLQATFMVLCFLGLYRLAQGDALRRRVLLAIAGINVVTIFLQAVGVFELVIPRVHYNAGRLLTGMTPSSADAGCVLAMCLPFVPGWWLVPAAAALLATQASSAIVAGVLGLVVAHWSRVRRWGFAGFVGGLMALGLTVNLVDGIMGVLTDDRWRLWGYTVRDWWGSGPVPFVLGSGWGAYHVGLLNGKSLDVFDQAHFDALQLGVEAGVVGLALAGWAFVHLVRRARDIGHMQALGAMAALVVAQFGHFPFRLASGAVVIALVAAEADGD